MNTFTLDLSALNASLNTVAAELDGFCQRTEHEVARRLVAYSPVDTGRFRGNWQFGDAHSPPEDALDALDPEGDATVAHLAAQIAAAKPGAHTFANNLPYAMALEFGHSSQAPHGIVARVADELDDIVAMSLQRSAP